MIRLPYLAIAACWSAALFAFVMAVIPHQDAIELSANDKVEHMIAFFTITLLARAAYPATAWWRVLLIMTGFGAVIELVQAIPALHRDSSVYDLLADMAATAVALLLTWPAMARLRGARTPADAARS